MRHPVVITSLTEDFRKIGLIKDEPLEEGASEKTMGSKDLPKGDGGETGTGSPGSNTHKEGGAADMKMGYQSGGDRLTGKHKPPKGKGIDQMEDEDEDFDPIAEAMEYSEAFDEEWDSMGDKSEIDLDEDDMEMFDSMAEDIVELPGGVLDEDSDLDDEDEEPAGGTMEAVAESMARIEAIMESMGESGGSDAAIPAFANVALIAERLAVFFDEYGDDDASGHFAEMAEEAAGIVQVLREDDEEDINFDLVNSTFVERMDDLLKGLEIYSNVTEGDDEDDEDDEGND